jgi:hypothetical protein
MKFVATLLLVGIAGFATAQNLSDKAEHSEDKSTEYNGIGGSIGASIFKGKPYLLLGFAPQFEFGNWAVGIDGAIRISNEGKLRKEDFDELYDAVRFINYVRFGKPVDDFYGRIGGLSRASLGHGTIVDNYSNNSSYDDRKIGAAAKLDLGFVGAEALSSDIFSRTLLAGRGFTRPFHLTPLGLLWFFSNIELGATASFDFDDNASRIIPNHEPYVSVIKVKDSPDDPEFRDSLVINRDSADIGLPLEIFGLDATVMVYQSDNVEGRVYGDFVKIVNFNQGYILGARSSFFLDSTTYLDLRFERHLFKNYFLPNYYNSFYERERYNDDVTTKDYITKATRLADTATGQGNGFKFGGFLRLEKEIEVSLEYAHLDNVDHRDLMNIIMTFPDLYGDFFGAITYQRRNIESPSDYFGFDENTIAQARLSYQPFKFVVLSLITQWTFERDKNNHVSTQTRIEPKVSFIAKF